MCRLPNVAAGHFSSYVGLEMRLASHLAKGVTSAWAIHRSMTGIKRRLARRHQFHKESLTLEPRHLYLRRVSTQTGRHRIDNKNVTEPYSKDSDQKLELAHASPVPQVVCYTWKESKIEVRNWQKRRSSPIQSCCRLWLRTGIATEQTCSSITTQSNEEPSTSKHRIAELITRMNILPPSRAINLVMMSLRRVLLWWPYQQARVVEKLHYILHHPCFTNLCPQCNNNW